MQQRGWTRSDTAGGGALPSCDAERSYNELTSLPPSAALDLSPTGRQAEDRCHVCAGSGGLLCSLASGKSNAEVASSLYVGEGTIKTHVSHILTKLALRDRMQAVVFAYESGLVVRGS